MSYTLNIKLHDVPEFYIYSLWFLIILFRSFGFITLRAFKMFVFFTDLNHVIIIKTNVFILLRPFGFLAPRFCLSCLDLLVFLLPDFVYPV
jgi:hypothetical protein